MNFSQIKETCLYVKDLQKAKSFYHGILDMPILGEVEGKHIFFRAGSSVLLCFNPDDSRTKKSPPPHYGGGKQHLAFEVPLEAYEKSKQELISKGITITDKVIWKSGRESFYFEDPEGNVLEIVPNSGIWD